MTSLARLGTFAFAAIAGAVYGMVGTVSQASALAGIPVGLVLALVGATALMIAVRRLADRWASLATGVGLTLAIVVLSGHGSGGSVIAPAEDLRVWIWAIAAPAMAAVIVAWPSAQAFAGGRPANPESVPLADREVRRPV